MKHPDASFEFVDSSELRLVLASSSPRRRELLSQLGLEFEVRPADVDESVLPGETASVYVERLALEKAAVSSASSVPRSELVLAADTIVVLDGLILGKPEDEDDARRVLHSLADREHEVMTAVAVENARADRRASEVTVSRVRFGSMSDEEVDWYVSTGEPMDKAGSYGIQGFGALFIDGIVGSQSNVVGLPLRTTYRLLASLGLDIKHQSKSSGPA